LIGTSLFILGLRIQSAARTNTTGVTPSQQPSSTLATLPSLTMHKYFELLILALVYPSVGINAYGLLLVESNLYLPDHYLLPFCSLHTLRSDIIFCRKLRIAK
jgi:hypothetical protein